MKCRRISRLSQGLISAALLGAAGCQTISLMPHMPPAVVGSHDDTEAADADADAAPPARVAGDEAPLPLPAAASAPALLAVPPVSGEQPIELAEALLLGGADNPTIAIAEQAVAASQAQLLQARAMLLPTLDAGGSVNVHQGNLLSAQGVITDVNRQSLYAGAGAFAVGAGTVGIPGVRLTAHLADACFGPAAAQQNVAVQRFAADATRNVTLLAVATGYFDLVAAEARLAAIRQSQAEFAEVDRLTANFARAGQGRSSDANRARGYALLLRSQEEAIQEEVAVAGARLARLLSINPEVRLRAAAVVPPLLQLVPPKALPHLIEVALRGRPEIHAASAALAVAQTHSRQERVRPFLPLLSVGYSAGTFGGGNSEGSRFGNFGGRGDFDALAVWSLDNFGLGNRATQRQRQAVVEQAAAERAAVIDRVRREIADAAAQSAGRLEDVTVTRRQLARAAEGYQLDLTRAKNLEGRPIEVLNSVTNLANARLDLIRATIAYTQAQFRLFVALGQPPVSPSSPDAADHLNCQTHPTE